MVRHVGSRDGVTASGYRHVVSWAALEAVHAVHLICRCHSNLCLLFEITWLGSLQFAFPLKRWYGLVSDETRQMLLRCAVSKASNEGRIDLLPSDLLLCQSYRLNVKLKRRHVQDFSKLEANPLHPAHTPKAHARMQPATRQSLRWLSRGHRHNGQ